VEEGLARLGVESLVLVLASILLLLLLLFLLLLLRLLLLVHSPPPSWRSLPRPPLQPNAI